MAIFFLGYTVYLTRKDRTEIGQIRKWILLALLMLFGAIFSDFGIELAHLMGLATYASFILFFLVIVLLIFVFRMQISLINLQNKIKLLTQELSIVKHDRRAKEEALKEVRKDDEAHD